jgi:hypothetical protein
MSGREMDFIFPMVATDAHPPHDGDGIQSSVISLVASVTMVFADAVEAVEMEE